MPRSISWVGVICALCTASAAHAQLTIASQDFNALDSSATLTNDILDSGEFLTNDGSFNASGPGLLFDTYWFQTRVNLNGPRVPTGQTGAETSGDFIGVNAATVNGLPTLSPGGAAVGAAGDHNFEFNDGDGRLDLVFEPVDVSGYQDRQLRFHYWVVDDSYETGDSFTATLSDGVNSVTVLNLVNAAVGPEGSWVLITVDLEPLIQLGTLDEILTLTISVDTNANTETVAIDNVAFLADVFGGPLERTIPEIQGTGTLSPYADAQVSTEGVVTADFQGGDELAGFFMQAVPGDGDPLSSDGIFVSASDTFADVDVGDRVTVVGGVIESGQTRIDASAVTIDGSGAVPAPTTVALPEANNGDLERNEGMLIQVSSVMTVAQNFFLGRYGQMTLSSPNGLGVAGRMLQPTQLFDPGTAQMNDLALENQRRLLVLDDGQDVDALGDNPDPVPYIGPPPPIVSRAGDRVSNLVGVLDFGQINSVGATDFRLHPTVAPTFTPQNLRPTTPPTFNGLSVVSLNVLNFFTTLGSRGAFTANELIRQRNKLVQTIVGLDADVYGLIEIENNTAAIANLVTALNTATTPNKYAFVDTGVIGTDEIKVAFIYTTATISKVGNPAVLTDAVDVRAMTTRNRPALAQTFRETATNEVFTVVINHWKSKGSACNTVTPGTNEIVDPDTGDGQGNCNLSRRSMALALVDWINAHPTGSTDPDVLIIGDLNSYAKEDPIKALEAAGYVNLVHQRVGTSAYSYVFDGQSGYLDHAFARGPLANRVQAVNEWHTNADEPQVIDYDEGFNPPGYYAVNPFRASDHDPLLIGLNLQAAAVPFATRTQLGLFALGLLIAAAIALRPRR